MTVLAECPFLALRAAVEGLALRGRPPCPHPRLQDLLRHDWTKVDRRLPGRQTDAD